MHICRKKTPKSDAGRRSRCFEDAPVSQWSSILQCNTGKAHLPTPHRSLKWLFILFFSVAGVPCIETNSRLTTPNVIHPSPYPTHRNPSQYPKTQGSPRGPLPMSNLSLAAELRPSRDTFVRTTHLQITGTWLCCAPLWIPSTHFSTSGRTVEAMKSSIACSDPRHACSMHTIFHTFPH